MKFNHLLLVFTTIFVTFVSAAQWSPEDYEIFTLNDKIQQDLGKDVTFYSWLELEKGPKSTIKEISKAYRKLSRTIHPDKLSRETKKIRKQAEDRFQRLSLVGNILRDAGLKKRYDYFYAKGFPTWKGTGYYYSKYRPGFLFTLFLIFFIVSGLHFVALRISRSQDFGRVVKLKEQLKSQAWGGSLVPPVDGSDRKLQSEIGKTFLIQANGNVYFLDSENKDSKELYIALDENDINVRPGFKDSLLFKVPCLIWNKSLGRFIGKIDSTVVYHNEKQIKLEDSQEESSKKKSNKKVQRGQKVELPNGKVVYSRTTNSRKR